MTEEIQHILSRKLEWRRQLAALPVGEKLRMLEEMVAGAKSISATEPAEPACTVLDERGPLKRAVAGFFGGARSNVGVESNTDRLPPRDS